MGVLKIQNKFSQQIKAGTRLAANGDHNFHQGNAMRTVKKAVFWFVSLFNKHKYRTAVFIINLYTSLLQLTLNWFLVKYGNR